MATASGFVSEVNQSAQNKEMHRKKQTNDVHVELSSTEYSNTLEAAHCPLWGLINILHLISVFQVCDGVSWSKTPN